MFESLKDYYNNAFEFKHDIVNVFSNLYLLINLQIEFLNKKISIIPFREKIFRNYRKIQESIILKEYIEEEMNLDRNSLYENRTFVTAYKKVFKKTIKIVKNNKK